MLTFRRGLVEIKVYSFKYSTIYFALTKERLVWKKLGFSKMIWLNGQKAPRQNLLWITLVNSLVLIFSSQGWLFTKRDYFLGGRLSSEDQISKGSYGPSYPHIILEKSVKLNRNIVFNSKDGGPIQISLISSCGSVS